MEFQLGCSAVETIRAKQNFEKFSFNHGVIPITYLTDSGAFKANKFVQQVKDHNQISILRYQCSPSKLGG